MNIHHKKPVNYDAVVQKFAEQQPRRMLLADPIFEESWIFNWNEFKCLSVSINVSVKKIHPLNYCSYHKNGGDFRAIKSQFL